MLQRQGAYENTLSDWIDIDRMFVDRYGRPLSEPKVAKLAARWSLQKCAPLLLSYRDDQDLFAILDGGHRREAARRNSVTKLPCFVHLDLTYLQEADLYLAYATVNPQSAVDRFRARIEGHEPHALAIQRICNGQGLQLSLNGPRSNQSHERHLNSFRSLEDIYQMANGPLILAEALRICDIGMAPQRGAFDSLVLRGMGLFLARYDHDPLFRPERLIDRLKRVGPHGLIQRAKALEAGGIRGGAGGVYGQAIRAIYNSGLLLDRHLPEWGARATSTEPPEHRIERGRQAYLTRVRRFEENSGMDTVNSLDSDS